MNPGCGFCNHYCQRSYKFTTGQKNVFGGVVWYRAWAKHRCNLEQEDKYPRNCNFEENVELREELRRRFSDLAKAEVNNQNLAVLLHRMLKNESIIT